MFNPISADPWSVAMAAMRRKHWIVFWPAYDENGDPCLLKAEYEPQTPKAHGFLTHPDPEVRFAAMASIARMMHSRAAAQGYRSEEAQRRVNES